MNKLLYVAYITYLNHLDYNDQPESAESNVKPAITIYFFYQNVNKVHQVYHLIIY